MHSRIVCTSLSFAVALCLATSACQGPPASKPNRADAAIQTRSAVDALNEERRFDDRGGRGGGF